MEKEKKNNNLVVIILFVFLMISLVLGAVGLMNRKEKPSDNTPIPTEPDEGGNEGGEYAPIVDDYSTMLAQVKDIFLKAQEQWILDNVEAVEDKTYSYCQIGGCGPTLTVDSTEVDYYLLLNKEGSITKYYATNGKYQYKYEGNGLSVEDIDSLNTVSDLPEEEVITIIPNM